MYLPHLTLHLTNKCNLQCTNCHVAVEIQSPNNNFESSLIDEKIVSNLFSNCSFGEISIAGGEPTASRSRLNNLLDLIAELSPVPNISITSNGISWTDQDLELWKSLKVRLQVSLDGPNAMHDAVRGLGSFERTMSNINRAISLGFVVDVLVAVSNRNIDSMPAFLERLDLIGIRGAGFLSFTPKGRGNIRLQDVVLADRWRKFVESLWELELRNLWLRPELCYLTPIESSLIKESGTDLCCNFFNLKFVYADLTDGLVYPCGLLFNTMVQLGSLRAEKLESILLRSNLEQKSTPLECNSCKSIKLCRGGCKAYAALSDSPLGRDPRCSPTYLPVCPFLYIAIPPNAFS